MKGLAALALTTAVTAGFPAFADDCRSAADLERQLVGTPPQPFVAKIDPAKPGQSWTVAPWGGFQIAAPGLGEVTVLRGAAAELVAACGLRLTWTLEWNGRVKSAKRFKVVTAEQTPLPRPSVTFSATRFGVTPDRASQTAWLTIIDADRSEHYLLDFPATAISLLPDMHGQSLRLEVAGVRADGVLVYAELSAFKTR